MKAMTFKALAWGCLLGFVMKPIMSDSQKDVLANMPLPAIVYPPSLTRGDFISTKTGAYYFQYDTGAISPASFRGESRDENGKVTGHYGYVDDDGVMRITHYIADENGYRSKMVVRFLQSENNR